MRCQYCRADVPDLANHYGGYLVPACPDVAYAFGPEQRRDRHADRGDYPLLDENAAIGPYGHGQTRAEKLERQRREPSRLKRRAPTHEGMRL